VRADDDPRAPLFFLSYARSGGVLRPNGPPHEPSVDVIRLFQDLSKNVAELVSRGTGREPGFMDRSMQGGGRWTEELLHAVGTCQVFVALLSAPFLKSEWCGMEWYGFSQRTVTTVGGRASSHQTCIIPVVWAPVPEDQYPPPVHAVQRFSPVGLPDAETARQYENDGVFGLLRMGQESAYQTVLWRLAQRIAELYYSHRVEPRPLARTDLRNIFEE
jgi:TIR domain